MSRTVHVRPRRVALLAGLALLLAGCGAGSTEAEPGTREPAALGHVHGLGTDPADGTLYAATHFGVFRLPAGGPPVRVAGRWQDTMAFTVVGPGHFLAGGHPDLREDQPVHLGLVESTDAARTWEPLSLYGEADFHALEPAGRLLYGYDSLTGRLVMTADREQWQTVAEEAVGDLAVHPADPEHLLATTASGLVRYTVGRRVAAEPVAEAPPLALLDWPTPDLLVGVTRDGQVYRSDDAGETWQRAASPPGEPQALDVNETAWYVATSSGVHRSADEGRTWEPLAGG